MNPTRHPSNNSVLAPPPGVSAEECGALPITRVMFPNGMPAVWSYWQPTEAERAAIAAGAPVRLSCWGLTHPPIALHVSGAADDPEVTNPA
jgi:hypothetical protein